MIHHVLFDLDGTLTDPAKGITGSVRHAMAALGIPIPSQKELERFIGPPLDESFREFCGLSPQEIDKAVYYFRQYFSTRGIHENELFPGIPELLSTLQYRCRALYIATSKPQIFAKDILERFGLTPYFTDIVGSPLDNHGSPKAEIVKTVLERNEIDPATVAMVGDRRHDIIGAKANGLVSVGVLYGYGDRAEHEAAGADHIAEDIPALLGILNELTE